MGAGVHVEKLGPLLTITLARPPVNSLDLATPWELHAIAKDAASRPEQRVVMLRSGLEAVFSAGMDVADHAPDCAGEMLEAVHALFVAWDALPQSSVAVVDGRCRGGAFELLLLCDAVFSSARSDFAFPEIGLGCFPPTAAALLPSLAGRAAAELILTGAVIGALEAVRLGLVTRVTEDPAAAGLAYAEAVASKSGVAVAQARRAMREAGGLSLSERLRRAEAAYAELLRSEDAAEGVRAFLEKRRPAWRHR